MKSRKHAKTNRRKFRATKSKVYRKSIRNVKKIMRGGMYDTIFTSTKLDEVLKNPWANRIQIEKNVNYNTVDQFKKERLSGIPTLNINDTSETDGKIRIFASKKKNGDVIFNQIIALAKKLLDEEAEIKAENKTVSVMVM